MLWDVLVDFPALVRLVYRLLKDGRVSRLDKAILGGILVYVLNPMDLLPDAIPGLGQVDDMYLVALALLRLLSRADESVLRKHWRGKREILPLLQEIVEAAMFYLPGNVRRRLATKIMF